MDGIYPGIRGTRCIPCEELVSVEQSDETAYYEERGVEPVGGGSAIHGDEQENGEHDKEMKEREDHMLVHLVVDWILISFIEIIPSHM